MICTETCEGSASSRSIVASASPCQRIHTSSAVTCAFTAHGALNITFLNVAAASRSSQQRIQATRRTPGRAGCAALDTVSFQCCPWLGDEGFRALCARCPLRHITLKHCAVTQEAIDQAEQAHPQLQIRCVQSGNRL